MAESSQGETKMSKFKILNVQMTGDAEYPRRITAERGAEFVVFEAEEGGYYFERTGEKFVGVAASEFLHVLLDHDEEVAMRADLVRRAQENAERVKRFAEIRGLK